MGIEQSVAGGKVLDEDMIRLRTGVMYVIHALWRFELPFQAVEFSG